jgi:hypothetical protein
LQSIGAPPALGTNVCVTVTGTGAVKLPEESVVKVFNAPDVAVVRLGRKAD